MMKDIKDFPGYKINENGVVINKKGHVMSPAISNTGYLRVALETYDENGKLVKRYNKSINRLVAQTFIPNPDNLPVVMHLDNDTFHNHASNLKWGTASDNMRQAFDEGRKFSPKATKCLYEVTNGEDSIKCKGTEGVAELLGYTTQKTVRPGEVKSGKYKGYTVVNTGIRLKYPIHFMN